MTEEVSPEDWVAAGRVLRPHGLSGEAVVEPWTYFPERFGEGRRLFARSGGRLVSLTVSASRPHRGALLVRFAELTSVEDVEALRDADLCADPSEPVKRPEGYFFHHELRGLLVVDRLGASLGHVEDLQDLGPSSLLVVRTARGLRDVPFVAPIVVSVDLASGTVVLDPPEGLLD